MLKIGKMSKVMGRLGLKLRKYSPEILVGAGIIGVVTTAILAVRATASERYTDIKEEFETDEWKLDRAIDDAKVHPIKRVQDIGANGAISYTEIETYPENEQKKDRKAIYKRKYMGLIKLYTPYVSLGTLSVVSILGGFQIVRQRNVAIMAAYSIVDKAFKDYRSRVKEKLGEEADLEFMHDVHVHHSSKKTKQEDGTTKVIESTTQVLKGETVSMYARIFDETNHQFSTSNPTFNWLYIKKKLDYLNDQLHARGHVFLNEAYDELGFPHTKEGAVVGWISNLYGGEGDNYISFGPWSTDVFTIESAGKLGSILIDFNVDGVIWDKI